MSDETNKPKNLSDISHLFLSNIRQQAQGNSSRPVRRPPPSTKPESPAAQPPQPDTNRPNPTRAGQAGFDLTPAELAGVSQTPDDAPPRVPVTLILASHLNGSASTLATLYVRSVAAVSGRVGLVEMGDNSFRLSCVEPDSVVDETVPQVCYGDGRELLEAMQELAWDLRRWFILPPNPRSPDIRPFLETAERAVLLCTGDHDGIVSAYRSLKGLPLEEICPVSLAVLNARDDAEAARVRTKLASVCRQFLSASLLEEGPVRGTPASTVHRILMSPPEGVPGDSVRQAVAHAIRIGGLATGSTSPSASNDPPIADDAVEPESIPAELRANALGPDSIAIERKLGPESRPYTEPFEKTGSRGGWVDSNPAAIVGPNANTGLNATGRPTPDIQADPAGRPDRSRSQTPLPEPMRMAIGDLLPVPADRTRDVIDLETADSTTAAVALSVVRHDPAVVECPIRPPACPEVVLAVDRDRGLVIVAAADVGLSNLRSIGLSFRWASENLALIAMAMPQMRIDSDRGVTVRLLVDPADIAADVLQPLLGAGFVRVQSYRRLRWAGRCGVLLNAA